MCDNFLCFSFIFWGVPVVLCLSFLLVCSVRSACVRLCVAVCLLWLLSVFLSAVCVCVLCSVFAVCVLCSVLCVVCYFRVVCGYLWQIRYLYAVSVIALFLCVST